MNNSNLNNMADQAVDLGKLRKLKTLEEIKSELPGIDLSMARAILDHMTLGFKEPLTPQSQLGPQGIMVLSAILLRDLLQRVDMMQEIISNQAGILMQILKPQETEKATVTFDPKHLKQKEGIDYVIKENETGIYFACAKCGHYPLHLDLNTRHFKCPCQMETLTKEELGTVEDILDL